MPARDVPDRLAGRIAEMEGEHQADGPARERRRLRRQTHALILVARLADFRAPDSFELTAPPTADERWIGRGIAQAFHAQCLLADVALAAAIPADRVIAIGKRHIRGTKWLRYVTAPEASEQRE